MIKLNLHKTLNGVSGDLNLNLDLNISKGEFVTLYGNSGVGKTSILRMLSGLMLPNAGKIIVDDEVWFDTEQKINLKPQQRQLGYVFQDYGLFPNMTVRQNLEFAREKYKKTNSISELMDIIELQELQDRKPNTLSGGQQQRVALARALVQQPKLLLLDEPLSALDNAIRIKLQDYILKAHNTYGLTTILVSHDIGEVMKLSDRMIVIEDGQIIKQGAPLEVFVGKTIDSNVKLTGIVIAINSLEVTIFIAPQTIKIKSTEKELSTIKVGDTLVISSEIVNPKLYKIS